MKLNSIVQRLTDEGGMLGGPAPHPSVEAQANFLNLMMLREGKLYPILKQLLKESKGNAEQAYEASVGEANKLYPEAMAAVSDFQMPPETLAALNKIRETRFANTDADVNRLIGGKIGALAERGITSADTAAGMGRSAETAMLPVRNQADTDYQNLLLTMPSKIAMAKYGMGVNQGNLNAEALRKKYQDVLGPYLDMWRTTAGLGSTPPPDTSRPGQSEAISNIANLVGTFVDKNKKPAASANTSSTGY